MKIKALYKRQQLWDTVLFSLNKTDDILLYKTHTPAFIYSPQRLLRAKYHQVTGYADPFLFENKLDGYLYLFNEKELHKAPAPIIAQRTKDFKHWEQLGIILQEPFHLSFPFVFEHEGEIFMIPETRSQEAVILYKAEHFPYDWKQYKTLIQGGPYVDSSVIFHNGFWFLFTTAWDERKSELRIFYSDKLDGNYIEHPHSPVSEDLSCCRCGGSVFKYQGKLFRPAQNCKNYYGENVAIYEVTNISPTQYNEVFVKNLIDKSNSWSKYGGHQFNFIEFRGKHIVAVDGIVDDNWFNNHTRKMFNFVHNHITK